MNNLNTNELDILSEIAKSLQEINQWVRLIGFPAAKTTLENVLDTDEKKIVYHLCDGNRGAKEIATQSGVNIRYVSEWGQAWEVIGILAQSKTTSVKGRRQKLFELSDFGISIPNKLIKQVEVSTDEHAT
ncbi:MAG: hypothetical protein WBW94_16000 [Anaerolineales bacterium]